MVPVRFFRMMAAALLLAAQVLAVSQCAACDRGDCPTRDACGCCATSAQDSLPSGCLICGSAAASGDGRDPAPEAGGCHPDESVHPTEDGSASAPCRCQFQPRSDRPLDRPHNPGIDVHAGLPLPAHTTRADVGLAPAVGRLHVGDVPERPVRILLGVWRN